MANIKYIGQDVDHDGNAVRNFVLWLLTTANVALKVIKEGMIAFDTQRNVVVIHDGTSVRDLVYKETQEEVTDDYTPQSSDYRGLVIINKGTAVTITVDDIDIDGYYCELFNVGAGPVTISAGTATVNFPDGSILETNKVCTIFKRDSNGEYYVKGELTT